MTACPTGSGRISDRPLRRALGPHRRHRRSPSKSPINNDQHADLGPDWDTP